MTFAKDDLIAALRMRYDFYSAESVFDLARQRASVDDKPAYEPADVRAIRAVLPSVGDRLTAVLARFDELLEAAPAGKGDAPKAAKAEAKPEPKAEAKPEPKPEPKAEAKPEPKAEAKPEPKAEKPATDAKAETIETTIVLTGVDANEGDQVLVCGGFPELGEWKAENAKPMKRDGDQWLTTLQVAPDAELSFKFLRRTSDGEVIWEDGDNRTIGAKPRLEVTWR